MYNGQLELSLANGCARYGSRHGRRRSRARWWFEHMRQVVDRAIERYPAPAPRPEQMVLPGAHRQVLVK